MLIPLSSRGERADFSWPPKSPNAFFRKSTKHTEYERPSVAFVLLEDFLTNPTYLKTRDKVKSDFHTHTGLKHPGQNRHDFTLKLCANLNISGASVLLT